MLSQIVKGDANADTYIAASITYSATAAPTDVWTITGSATRIVRVHRVIFSGTQTVAGNINTVTIKKHSVANTAGSSSSVTCVPVDSSQIPADATVKIYTANPTVDATAQVIWQQGVLVPAPATAVPGVILDFDFTQLLNGKPITLRGIAQELSINMGGALPTGFAGAQVTCIFTMEKTR